MSSTSEHSAIACPVAACGRELMLVREYNGGPRKPSRTFLQCMEHGEQVGPQQRMEKVK